MNEPQEKEQLRVPADTIDTPAPGGPAGASPHTLPEATIDHRPPPTAAWRPGAGEDHDVAFSVTGEVAVLEKPACPAVANYDILGVLGRGGMGIVYQARQRALNRLVALKMILAGVHADPEYVIRFQAEAEAVARLRHANIVQIYEIGTHEGFPFFSLEYVEGGTLAKKLDNKPQPIEETAQTIETLARATHYAHVHGIVHRDLKPANVLLTADGVLKITDFGLAKRLQDDSSQTRTGTIVGTPSYMAPEQAWGKVHDVGPLADVYALGVILYEMLTGRPPFQGASTLDTLEQVRLHEPVPPSRLQPRIPADLETICLKCLEKEPARRYRSAEALADDLKRFRDGEPIQARPVGAVTRTWKWAKRRPSLTAFLLLLAVVLSVGFPAMTVLWIKAVQASDQANRNAELARGNAQRANEEKKAALEQQQLTLKTMYDVVTDFQKELKKNAGLQQLRLKLLERAETAMEKAVRGADPSIFDRTMAGLFQRRGDNLIELNRIDDALAQFQQCLAIVERVERDTPEDPAAKRNLAIACIRVADTFSRLGNLKAAEDYHRRALDLRKAWSELAPQDKDAKIRVAESYHGLGSLWLRQGDALAARAYYLQSQQWQEALPVAFLQDPDIQRERAGLYDKLGEIHANLGEGSPAREYFLKAMEIRKGRADADPLRTVQIQRDMFISYKHLGDVSLLALQDVSAAKQYYAEAMKLSRKLVEIDPNEATVRGDLADACYRLATACLRAGDKAEADRYYQECLKRRQELAGPNPNVLTLQCDLMLALARCGQHIAAAQIGERLRREAANNPQLLYLAATGYALCSLALGDAAADDRPALTQRYQDAALATLREALARGWKDVASLQVDPDLDGVRDQPGFQELLKQLKQPTVSVPRAAPGN